MTRKGKLCAASLRPSWLAASGMGQALSAQRMAADPPTYTKDIVPITQEVCTRCHTEGGLGPMPLTTYEEVARYAPRIKNNVQKRIMPHGRSTPRSAFRRTTTTFR